METDNAFQVLIFWGHRRPFTDRCFSAQKKIGKPEVADPSI